MASAAVSLPTPIELFTALPWPAKSVILSMLPLQSCLSLAATSRGLHSLVLERNARVVSVDFNELPGTKVSDAIAWTLRNELTSLRSLSASGAACLEALLAACTLRPEGLLLAGSLQPRLRQLTSLSLDTLKQLQDAHLALVLPHCPNLEVLALPRCSKLTDAAAVAVGSQLPRLRVVVCRDWPCLTDAGVGAMAAGCPGLEDVTLDGCLRVGTESLSLLARCCRGLRRLSIAKSYGVTDGALAALGEWCGALEEVAVRQCPRVAAAGHLAACGRLAAVDFSGCSRLDGSGLRALLCGPAGASLTSLQLNGCVGLSGEAVAALGKLCPGLRDLNLRGLQLLDENLAQLALGCSSLRSLSLAWCTKITDAGLVPLLERNPQLQDLDIEALYNLSDAALATLAAAAPRLARLSIRMCHRLTTAAVVAVVAATQLRALLVSGILDESGTLDLVARVRRARPSCTLHW